MALVLTAYDVIVRVDALADGLAAFAAQVPNRTFCTDGQLATVSFMREADRDHFVSTTKLRPGSFARADKGRGSDAEWVEVGRYAGVDAVWLRGSPGDPLVVPVTWTPGELILGSMDDIRAHLEHVGTEGNVEIYLDKRTGQKLYTGRTRPEISDEETARLAALSHQAAELVQDLMFKRSLGFFERRRVKKAVRTFDQLLSAMPEDWQARWMLGMSLRSLGEHDRALAEFRQAYATNPRNPDVGREFAGQCFFAGAADEGVRISRELHARFPDDIALHSNLGLALLIGGDLAEAQAVAEAALARDPSDAITRNLVEYVLDVRMGIRSRPTRMPGM